jgi:hypothetical protein
MTVPQVSRTPCVIVDSNPTGSLNRRLAPAAAIQMDEVELFAVVKFWPSQEMIE